MVHHEHMGLPESDLLSRTQALQVWGEIRRNVPRHSCNDVSDCVHVNVDLMPLESEYDPIPRLDGCRFGRTRSRSGIKHMAYISLAEIKSEAISESHGTFLSGATELWHRVLFFESGMNHLLTANALGLTVRRRASGAVRLRPVLCGP